MPKSIIAEGAVCHKSIIAKGAVRPSILRGSVGRRCADLGTVQNPIIDLGTVFRSVLSGGGCPRFNLSWIHERVYVVYEERT